ncbi:glycosyltransferase family 4 protein [bacterium]|nr:glycosyltransferase family 4 protein [bacterium]
MIQTATISNRVKDLSNTSVLMLSIDQTLVGGQKLGDAIARHQRYGDFLKCLDILVYSNKNQRLKQFSISDKVIGYPSNSLNKLTFLFGARKLAKKIIKERQTDLIICQDPFVLSLLGVWLKKKFKIKLLIHFHGDFWDNSNWLKERLINRLFLWISKYTVQRADAVRVMSQGQKEKLIKAGIEEKKIQVISTPVDVSRFENYDNQEQMKTLLDMQEGKKMILMVGRKDKVKDFDTLFRAMTIVHQKNKDAGLWLVGNYSPEDELPLPKDMKIIISGRVDSLDLPAYYKISYLTVLSSTSESFGKVLVEANVCGKPVVSTATTGAKEIIKNDHNGYLVPIGDAQALADKILYLLRYPDEARIMGENGRRLIQQKFGDNMQIIVQFWNQIVNNQL